MNFRRRMCVGVAVGVLLLAACGVADAQDGGAVNDAAHVRADEPQAQIRPQVLPEPEVTRPPEDLFDVSEPVLEAVADSGAPVRVEFSTLQHFILHDSAIVRVVEVEQWPFTNRFGLNFEMQTSTLEVIEPVQGVFPATISVTQTVDGVDWAANALREDGVYLLPLIHEDGWNPRNDSIEPGWRIVDGALDVQFEIDDAGLVWSNSTHTGFNQFDGRPAQELVDALVALSTSENFAIAQTDLGRLAGSLAFAEITVSSHELVPVSFWEYYEYSLYVDRVLTTDLRRGAWSPELGHALALAWGESDVLLTDGGRYIAALYLADSDGERLHVRLRDMARINPDGAITGVVHTHWNTGRSESAFAQFNGYSVEQIVNVMERARSWYEMHR